MIKRLFWHWGGLVLGLYIITLVKPLGITFTKPEDLAWAALVLIVANTIFKPILVLISLPLVLLTLGLFLFVINAVILYTLSHFVPGFHVPSFTAAFFGALLLSFITSLFSSDGKTRSRFNVKMNINGRPARREPREDSGKVIDI